MPRTSAKAIVDLTLDLENFRTIPQKDEVHAVKAMISINPDRFWALMESLLDDGYLPTENILLIKDIEDDSKLIVKEGNRRIACLKIIFGTFSKKAVEVPEYIQDRIEAITDPWKDENKQVPCTVYESRDAETVDRIVKLAHGKGEKAGRDQWTSVARARHNRNVNKANEPSLDLLEKYLKKGTNISSQQIERWAGDYPLSVLAEAMKKNAVRFGVTNAPELAKKYPGIPLRESLEDILLNIGLETVGFGLIRDDEKFSARFGLPPLPTAQGGASRSGNSGATGAPATTTGNQGQPASGNASRPGTGQTSGASAQATIQGVATSPGRQAAAASNDPKAVIRAIKKFIPKGPNRDKIELLRREIIRLKLKDNPIAFCFLLRSMFEISAKAYCHDHRTSGLSYQKTNGEDKFLVNVLREITNHLTGNNSNTPVTRVLHGAIAELATSEGLLSVTSMNQLVHNPSFTVSENHISSVFGNVFPLLEAMNK